MADDPKALALARHYLEIENPKRALEALERSHADELESPEFWELRADALLRLGRYGEGARAAREGLARDPDEIVLLDLLCLCELNLDNLSSAEQALDRALELAPWHPHLLAHRAFLLAKQGRFDEAEDTIEDALATDPEDAMVLRARALVAAMNGDRRSAEEYSANLLALDPQDQMAHLVRGNVAAERAQFGRALRHYKEALRHDPSDEELAEIVRVNRVAAHPILVPLRPLIRFGRYRSWAAYLVVYWTLRAAGQDAIALMLGGVWLVIVAISWLAPPILTRYYARRSPGR